MKTIRCSSLPGFADCARRTAGRQYGRILAGHGYELRRTLPGVGSAIGTAIHAAAALYLRAKRDGEALPDLADCALTACGAFQAEIAGGAEWDPTTPNAQTAVNQIQRIVAALLPCLAARDPLIVDPERVMEATLPGGWMLTGHVDLFTADGILDDLKIGVMPRAYRTQLGGYILVLEAHGHTVRQAGMTYLKRDRLKNPQSPPEWHEYPVADVKREAWAAIKRAMASVDQFEATGDPLCLPANPNSMMCTPKYCPAWGTQFCTEHKQEKEA